MMQKKIIASTLAVLLAAGLAGCGQSNTASTSTNSSDKATTSQAEPKKEEKKEPANLVGDWKQSNAKSDTVMEATITDDTIEIFWVAPDSKSLYWSGSFTAPTEAGDYKFTSIANKDKTNSAMLASQDDTKEFSYSAADDILSYDQTAMGVTQTVKLTRK